jgi:hypothetical protein
MLIPGLPQEDTMLLLGLLSLHQIALVGLQLRRPALLILGTNPVPQVVGMRPLLASLASPTAHLPRSSTMALRLRALTIRGSSRSSSTLNALGRKRPFASASTISVSRLN